MIREGRPGPLAKVLLAVWVVVAALTIYIIAAGLPLRFAELRTTGQEVWSSGAVEYVDQQLHPLEAAVLTRAGLNIADYAAYIVILEFLLGVLFFASSLVIVWQRRDEWLAVTIAIGLLCIGLTEPAIDGAFAAVHPIWYEPLEVMQAFGLFVAFALAFLVFPNGRFIPPWTRYGFVFGVLLMLAWLVFPDLPFNPINGASFERTPLASTLFTSGLVGAGVLAQVQRYRHHATPLQRRQILAGAFGFLMLFAAELIRSLTYALTIPPEGPGAFTLFVNVVRYPIFILMVLFLPLGFGVAILRYDLWNFDRVLRRTALYSLLTAGGFAVYVLIVVLSSVLFNRARGVGTLWFTAAIAMAAALLFLPVYRFAQYRINRMFSRQWIDFQAELTGFSRRVRTQLTADEIAQELLQRVVDLMHCEDAALSVRSNGGSYHLAAIHGDRLDAEQVAALQEAYRKRLRRGQSVVLEELGPVALLIPLVAHRTDQAELVGVLACGPRATGQPYEWADVTLLAGMADQAASALLVAELVETERHLEAHRNSPLGQAEELADACTDRPTGQPLILELFERAVHDSQAAQQLAHLPAVLRNQGKRMLALLAEGCHLLIQGRDEIDAAIVGLQRVDRYLAEAVSEFPDTPGNRAVLAFCLAGLMAANLDEILAALDADGSAGAYTSLYFEETAVWIRRLKPLHEMLDKHRRSRVTDDRLAYLVDALSLCNSLHAQAAAQDTPAASMMATLLGHWIQILVDALSAERERIIVSLVPVTKRVLPERQTQLVLQVRNEGWRILEEVVVALEVNPRVESELADVRVGPLAPGDTARLHFPVMVTGAGSFSVTFRTSVRDEEGRAISFSTALPFEALGGGHPFRAIPNPYITGAPLQADSPLFVGRAEELAALQALLAQGDGAPSAVLTGPRRMGKTSLLNRLAATLGEDFVPVYVDLQGVGYTGGMGNLFFDIATEAAQALEMPWPSVAVTPADRPDFFVQAFLPQARSALGNRRLVFLLDEFEELAVRVQSGLLSAEVYGFLRHLVQHQPQLAWVFVGSRSLAELEEERWANLFSGAVHQRVGRLDASNARRLILEPVQGYLEYDDLAIDKILQLTAGHPYFLQVLCHAIVLAANRDRRVIVAAEDVDAAVTKAMEMSEAHLLGLWRELSPLAQQVVQAAARLLDAHRPVTSESLSLLLPADQWDALAETVAELIRSGVLTPDEQGGHRFVIELQRRWLSTYPNLS